MVRSLYETNIGAASRAMANMGAHDLVLIAPACEIGYPAQQAAASGQDALQNRRVYATWEDFLTEESPGVRLALTARAGQGRDLRDLGETLSWLKANTPAFQKASEEATTLNVDLIFGPENWGLSNEDIEHAHYAVSIPTYGENTSLNLAQAVLIALFICRQAFSEARFTASSEVDPTAAGRLDADLIEKWLEALGFELQGRGHNVREVMRRLLMHSVPTSQEVVALNVVLQQSIRKMHEYHQMRQMLGLEGKKLP